MTDAAELAVKADAFKAIRDKRLAMQREVDALKEQETTLRRELITTLSETEGLTGIMGTTCKIRLTHKNVPQVADWDELFAHIMETGEFELLQRRVGERAVKDRWEAGDTVPGVISVELDDLSVTKL